MSNPPPGFQLDQPPSGFRLDKPRGKVQLDPPNPGDNLRDLGTTYNATGQVVDGDTIRLSPLITSGKPVSGRFYGVDGFERGQLGYRPGQGPLNLGELAARQTQGYVTPGMTAFGVGDKSTYGRPVITLGQGNSDPVRDSLLSGTALAAPEYLRDDPTRRATYLEDERLARLNRMGAHGTQYMSPDIYRSAKRWGQKLRPDEEMVWSADVPELKPDLKRLSNEQEQAVFAFLARNSGNPNFGQADLDKFAAEQGWPTGFQQDPKLIEAVRKGDRVGSIDYSQWDQQALRDFKMANGFAGMRPEVQQAYNDVLSDPASTPDSLQKFSEANGLTFDPRDVKEFYAARARGENPLVPIPIINPGGGGAGSFVRGFGDPFGLLDEGTALYQTLGGSNEYRETLGNSDRSFGDIYRNNLRQNRAIIDWDETNHPYLRAGGQIASGFALPYGGGVRGFTGLAKIGAAEGAVNAFGSADGSLLNRISAIPGGVVIGGTLGGTLGKGAELAAPFIKKGVSKLSGGRLFPDMQPARVVSDNPAPRLPDTINIPPSEPGSLPLPALGERVPSAPRFGPGREPDWLDVQAYDAPPAGFVLDNPQQRGGTLGEAASNMGADPMPSLSSPRIRDLIDVNAGRATRLLDGPTDAMMRAATAKVQPGDLLPRPANEVQSLGEFNRISEGLYPNVRAPNERDMLTPRQFPSRANPDNMLNRKGPLDLAAFVRSQGGVADFRGELKAAGLSNAPRRADDFAGGENRLGPLLNGESGATLDDMAQRAWEAGYFPDHAQRPTIDEFVTSLGDTYRGVNRTFRPDDFGEIDAFNVARDQRLAVERSRQDGAPLAEDIGQPATLDDIIANTPPATAYDDWTNAVVSKVGNIRVDKLDTPQDIGQALKIADNIAGGFDAGRRGKISHAETQALAQDLGMTADDLLARRKGQAFSAEEAYAARVILGKSTSELVNMAKRLRSLGDDPGSEAMAQFRKALVRHTAIQESVSGMTAEAGRALQQFRMTANSRDLPGKVLEGLVNGGGSPKRLKEAADAILELERDPANLNRFVEKVSKPKFSDRAQEVWYNYLLSGPQTHMVNILSNTMTSLGQLPEHALAAGVGAVRRGFKRDASDRVLFSEVGARTIGMLQGMKEGLREYGRGFRARGPGGEVAPVLSRQGLGGVWKGLTDRQPADLLSKVEAQAQKAVPGIKGDILRIPTSFLTAEDEFFKAVASRMELSGLAVRQASKEGLKGQAAKERAAELLANPTDGMLAQSLDYARYLTFQRPLGDGPAGKISRLTQDHPTFKAVLPFIRTPTNLIKFTAERSPLAPLVKEWRQDFAAGGARRDLAIAKIMIGSGVGAVVAELASQGIITGSEPSDENKRRLLYANGWQPYSIKIGDTYYSYKRLDPFAMTFGTAADIATMGEDVGEDRDEKAGMYVATIVSNLASRTWLSGITDALDAIKDPERYSGNFIKRLIGAATVPTGSAQLTRTLDPTMRETPDIGSYMSSRMPGQSEQLLPKRDVWGQPIVSEGGVGPDIISPIWTSTDRKDPITLEALRVGAGISKPNKGDMTPEQHDRLQPVAGDLARKWIGELIASPEYRAMPKEDQAEEIRSAVTAARKEAKAHVLGGEPLDDVRPERKRRSAKPAGLPDGFALDAPPAGFVLDR